MDDLDDITEEELALAAQFAEELDAPLPSPGTGEDLNAPVALLKAAEHWAPREGSLDRGRAEVENWAQKAQLKAKARAPSRRAVWLAWLPLPAVAVLALIYGTRGASEPPVEMVAAPRPAEAALAEHAPAAPLALEAEERAAKDGDGMPGRAEAEAPPRAEPHPRLAMKKTARWHEGEVPPELLRAQAELLAARAKKEAFDRSAFDQGMKGYRTQLLARIDMEGR